MQEKKINNLIINKVENQQTYEKMKTQGLINNDELYLVGGGGAEVTSVKGDKETVFRTGDVNLTASNIGALAEDAPVIKYTEQTLNDDQKTQARTNIGAGAPASFTEDKNGNIVVNNADEQIAKQFLQSLTFPGLNYKYVNPFHSATYGNPYGAYIKSGTTIINYIVNTITEPGVYTAYVNRAVEDIPEAAKTLNSSLRGFISVSQLNKGSTKCYAFILLMDEASNFYVQYIKGNIGSGWKQMQDKISATGLLKSDGNGNITAATAGVDYVEKVEVATTTTPGLISAADKVKLNGIAENANNYTLPVATSSVLGGVKSGGDFTVNSSTGVVTIKHQSLADYAKTADVNTSLNSKVPTTRKINNKALSADITLSASDISGTVRYDTASQGLTTTQKANARTNIGAGTSSFSGNYNDLTNKPTIPSAITESTISGWGFTKNTGTYSKPSNGIPKSDLASAVQTSLDKADTALQSLPSHTHNYAGSSSAGGAANSVKTNLTIKLNSGITEGTNLFTFNGSTAKSIDITPSAIGAATSDHTHSYLPLSGGTLTGNLTGKYITGTWLQTTATSDKAGKFATIDENGWIYYRTASEVATDIGAVTTDTFVAYTEAEIQSMWDNISV